MGVEADPGPEGSPDRLRQEEGVALEDRRMDAPAGRGGLPVRPGASDLDPIILPTPARTRSARGFPRIEDTGPAASSSPGGGSSSRRSSTRSQATGLSDRPSGPAG